MAVSWIVVSVIIIVAAVLIFKSQDLVFIFALIKKYAFFFIFAGIAVYLVFSLYHIHSTYGVDLTSFRGIIEAGKIYLVWIKGLFGNIATLTGNVVNQDWSINISNITNTTK